MKIKALFFLFLLAAGFVSCGDKNKLGDDHIIPYTRVYTEIPINVGGEDLLSWIGKARYFSVATPNTGSLGYKGHGIIIYTSDGDEFHCFDATCTSCEDLESYMVQNDLKGSSAICPVCHTEFDLNTGYAFGNTTKIYPLKPYPILKTSNKLIVSYQ